MSPINIFIYFAALLFGASLFILACFIYRHRAQIVAHFITEFIKRILPSLLLSSMLLSSCKLTPEPPQYTRTPKQVVHKQIIGEYFKLAFHDATDINCRFGVYHAVNVGDSIIFYLDQGKGFYWFNIKDFEIKKN